MEQEAEPEQPFPFFRLPRELRDDIYDALFERKTTVQSSIGEPATWTLVSPIASMLRVSRQFMKEYKSRVKHNSSITIEGSGLFNLTAMFFGVPRSALAPVSIVEVTFSIYCDIHIPNMSKTQDCVTDCKRIMGTPPMGDLDYVALGINFALARCPLLRSLNIKLYMAKPCFKHFMTDHKSVTNMFERLTKLKVLPARNSWTGVVGPEELPQVMARWTSEKGMEVMGIGVGLLATGEKK